MRSAAAWLVTMAMFLGSGQAADLTALRAVHATASQSKDCWTLLQIDAYAQRHGLKMRAAANGLTYVGDPLLGCPQSISWIYDRGDHVLARAGRRIYHWDVDGAPVRPATRLPFEPDRWEPSVNEGWIGLVDVEERYQGDVRVPSVIHCAALNVTGAVAFDVSITGALAEGCDVVCTASDGSALVVSCFSGPLEGPVQPRLAIASNAGIRFLDGWSDPRAIGPQGRWLVARDPRGQLQLHSDGKQSPLRSVARGPETTVVITADRRLGLVGADGTVQDLPLPFGIADEGTVVGFPKWLILASGRGAVTVAGTDLLGQPTPGGQPQGEMLGAWRWSDLQAQTTTAQAHSVWPGPLSVATNYSASLYRWSEAMLECLDFNGDEPTTVPITTAPAAVTWAETDGFITMARLADRSRLLIDANGAVVWHGHFASLDMETRDWGLGQMEDGRWVILRCHRDPEERRTIILELPPGPWSTDIDRSSRWAVSRNTDTGAWRRYTLPSGELAEENPGILPAPEASGIDLPPGRFSFAGPRIYRKGDGPSADPVQGLDTRDAWRVGRTMIILGRGGRILLTGRKPGELVELGRCRGGDHFVQYRDGLGIADENGLLVGAIVQGPTLDTSMADQGLMGEALPPGPWRITQNRFVPPRSGTLVFNHEELGLWPRWLRNPDNEVMLMPLGCIILAADATGAKLLGTGL